MRLFLVSLIALIGVLSVFLIRQLVIDGTVDEIVSGTQQDLQLRATDAIAYTNKYAVAAVTLAKNPFIIEAVQSRDAQALEKAQNAIQFMQLLHSATDVKILAGDDLNIISSANQHSIGVSMKDRPYVQAALSGRLGRGNLYVGQRQRSYAIAAPIFSSSSAVIGVVLISASLNDLLNAWALSSSPVVAQADDDRIFLSNRLEWLGFWFEQSTDSQPTSSNVNTVLIEKEIEPGQVIVSQLASEKYRRFIKVTRDVPLLEWKLHQFVSYRKVIKQANLVTAITALLYGLLVLLWQLVRMSTARTARELEQQQEFARTLEERVARRTDELKLLNEDLESQVQERRNAEQDLRRAQRGLVQTTKMASIGQMSAALAHEYNQPISAIRFYADNSKSLFEQNDGEALRDNLDRIVSLTERMSGLTNSLRNFSYQPQVTSEPVKFMTAFDEAIMLIRPKISSEDVEVITDPDQRADCNEVVINCGQTRVVQVITNLISNAIDAMSEINPKELTLQWRLLDDVLDFRVKDLGAGIEESDRAQVFDAFYTTKSMGKGLGLGLFVVKSIIEGFNGELTIEDEPGYGGVFSVKFPVVKE